MVFMKLKFTDRSKTGPERYCPVLAKPLMGIVRACKKFKQAFENKRIKQDNLEIWNELRADDTDKVAFLLTLSKQRREYLAGLLIKNISDRALNCVREQILDNIRIFAIRDGQDSSDFVPALVRILEKPWRGNVYQPKSELLVEELIFDPKNGEKIFAALIRTLENADDGNTVSNCMATLRMVVRNKKDVSSAFTAVYEKYGLMNYEQKIEVLDFLNEAMKTDSSAAKSKELFVQILDREFAEIQTQYKPGWIEFIREAAQLVVNSKDKEAATGLVSGIQQLTSSRRFMGETNRNSPEFTEAIVALANILDELKRREEIWRLRRPAGIS